jgi:hypothetical protein
MEQRKKHKPMIDKQMTDEEIVALIDQTKNIKTWDELMNSELGEPVWYRRPGKKKARIKYEAEKLKNTIISLKNKVLLDVDIVSKPEILLIPTIFLKPRFHSDDNKRKR